MFGLPATDSDEHMNFKVRNKLDDDNKHLVIEEER